MNFCEPSMTIRREISPKWIKALGFCLAIGAIPVGSVGIARATAVEWSFEVIDVTRGAGGDHRIQLRPSPPGSHFPRSCETFVVHSSYDIEGWSSEGRKLASRSAHDRAIQMLMQAQATHSLVRIRAVGRGFGATPESPRCEVTSRALTFAPDPGGVPVIFSLHEDPSSVP